MKHVTRACSAITSGMLVFGLSGAVHAQQHGAAGHDHGTKPASLRAMMGEESGSEREMCSACNRSRQGDGMGMKGNMCMQGMGAMMSHDRSMPARPSTGALDSLELAALVPLNLADGVRDLAGEEIKNIQAHLSRKQSLAEGKMLKAKGDLKIALAAERVNPGAVSAALRSYADAQAELLQARLDAQAQLQALAAPVR